MKKIKILILLLIIFIIILFFVKGLKKSKSYDDFLFLKFGSNTYPKNANVNLFETANKDTLINEKIAPGSSGEFSIFLNANENLDYKVIFESLNEKPANLKFIAMNGENEIAKTNSLEEIQKYLSGKISKNEQEKIKIKWYWDFENKEDEGKTDVQDTNDAQKIKQYQFKVYAVAQKC